MTDEFTGIFDDLNPDDFTRATSAIAEMPRTETFADFVDDQLRAVRFAFASASGQIDPLATLASRSTERVFSADDDESLGQYVQRLRREAQGIQAEWLFIFKKTIVGTFARGDESTASDSAEAMQEALNDGTTMEAVYWYAEDHSGSEPARRHGFLTIVGNHLGDMIEGDAEQTVNLFNGILGSS